MAYNYSFADNETYSADDLNAITKRLVTSGIEDSFADGVAYNVSSFNEQGRLLYTSGVVPETCLTLKVVSDGEGKVLINPGRAFFDDGAVIEVEAGGESLSYTVGEKHYVYLKNDLLNANTWYPCCTVDMPTGDYVMLAEIDEEGTISDKRVYAKGKLPGYQSVAGNVMRLHKTFNIESNGNYIGMGESASFDLGPNNFQYILVYTEPDNGDTTHYPCLGIYDIAKNKYRSFYAYDRKLYGSDYRYDACSYEKAELVISRGMSEWSGTSSLTTRCSVFFELENNILNVSFKATANSTFPERTHSFDMDLILF